MSEEEKKAIELVKVITYVNGIRNDTKGEEEDYWALDTILKLVEKQQKEIEKYKNVIDNKEFTWKQKYEETFEYVKKIMLVKIK